MHNPGNNLSKQRCAERSFRAQVQGASLEAAAYSRRGYVQLQVSETAIDEEDL